MNWVAVALSLFGTRRVDLPVSPAGLMICSLKDVVCFIFLSVEPLPLWVTLLRMMSVGNLLGAETATGFNEFTKQVTGKRAIPAASIFLSFSGVALNLVLFFLQVSRCELQKTMHNSEIPLFSPEERKFSLGSKRFTTAKFAFKIVS